MKQNMKQRVTADRAEPATEDLAPPPRESVCWFSGLMETKLRENDHKGHWRNCDLEYMEQRIREEFAELSAALVQYRIASLSPHEATRTRYLGDRVKREAADVANFAMMIADRVRGELLDLDSAEPVNASEMFSEAVRGAREALHLAAPDLLDTVDARDRLRAEVATLLDSLARAEKGRDQLGAMRDAYEEQCKMQREVDSEWGGELRRKLGVARGMLDSVADDLEEVDHGPEAAHWEQTVREIRQILCETADMSDERRPRYEKAKVRPAAPLTFVDLEALRNRARR